MQINGQLKLPGDKSISHRAAIFSSLARGTSTISGFLTGEDTLNTLQCFTQLGVTVKRHNDQVEIESAGLDSFKEPEAELDAGNSGTAARLLLGLFSGVPGFRVTVTGDQSLQKRPMGRITHVLEKFGASYNQGDNLPITVQGQQLRPVHFDEHLGSAQVKSALVLAALASNVDARIKELKPSRDHTEKMLAFAGVDIQKQDNTVVLPPGQKISPVHYEVPGDISSAAFFVVAALLANEAELTITNVLLNPYRDHYLKVLQRMGGQVEVRPGPACSGEQTGDLVIRPSKLKAIEIQPAEIPSIIDEIPVLTIAGLFSEGEFSFRGAKELRAKESDRIASLCQNLRTLGVIVNEFEDGLSLQGDPGTLLNGTVESFHDHRIIMAFEIARLRSLANASQKEKTSRVDFDDTSWVNTSFPQFYDLLKEVTA